MNFRKYVCFVFAFIFFAGMPLRAAGSFTIDDFSHVSKIDLYSGKIAGEKTLFYFNLPLPWKDNFISAERESASDPVILEQINFYCAALSELYKPKLLFSLYVMDKTKWTESAQYKPVMTSKDYVFAVKYGTDRFLLPGDDNIYKSKLEPVSDVKQIKSFIQLPPQQEEEYELTVFVDGEPMYHKVELADDGVLYVNLREICELLDYKISWIRSSSTVVISKGSFVDRFSIIKEESCDHRKIKMRSINDRTYVSAIYFFRIFGYSIDNDEQKNVYIYTK